VRRSTRLAATAAALALALALPLATAQAAPALGVHIAVETSFIDGGPESGGPFTATGPAVDAGLICPGGDTHDVFGKTAGYQSEKGLNILLVKEFTCADGSGAFFVKLQVRLDARGDRFAWAILEGTEDHDTLHGAGTGYGDYPSDGEYDVLDVYDGMVTNPS
jgi:hypothetical protein